jgi:hypothetical protein
MHESHHPHSDAPASPTQTQEKTMTIPTFRWIWVLRAIWIVLALLIVFFGFGHAEVVQTPALALRSLVARTTPKPPALHYSIWRTAPLTIAEVFGRAPGCSDASADLIEMTARASIRAGLDPAIAAATVATESSCNTFAVSPKGAVGLMQVRISTWKSSYDFSGTVNMFNDETNVRVGSEIMEKLISEHGTVEGVQLYNGAGVGCEYCDGGYSARILSLAHK